MSEELNRRIPQSAPSGESERDVASMAPMSPAGYLDKIRVYRAIYGDSPLLQKAELTIRNAFAHALGARSLK